MKKRFLLLTYVCMAIGCLGGSASAEEADSSDYLSRIQGNYIELFPEFAKEEYRDLWVGDAKEILGLNDKDAQETIENLLQMYMSDVYGEAAVNAYGDMSEGFAFDCYFLGDVKEFLVDGDTISGTDSEGNLLFSHTYEYVEEVPYTEYEGYYMHLYRTEDEDAGDFTYFAFCDDTPDETYHLEFRYGESQENISTYYSGNYAFWLAAAIPADYSDELMANCIHLFTSENLGESEE